MIIKFPKNNCWGVYSFLIDNFYSYMKNFGFLKTKVSHPLKH